MRTGSLILLLLVAACQGDSEPVSFAQEKTCKAGEAYSTPIQGQANKDWFVTNYTDIDPTLGSYFDYRGGFFTYDNHNGTDFALLDFDQMDSGIDVYAAKCGVVVALHDGQYDRNTQHNKQPWNYVEVSHPDGSHSVYGHLKKDSVTVTMGQSLVSGQKLGQVGSSGNSTGPHLHFEVRDSFDTNVDPFAEGHLKSAYTEVALVLDSGITTGDDPALVTDFFLDTPANNEELFASERAVFWIKLAGLRSHDTLAVGQATPGLTPTIAGIMTAKDNYKVSYWYWDLGNLEIGEQTFETILNGEVIETTLVLVR